MAALRLVHMAGFVGLLGCAPVLEQHRAPPAHPATRAECRLDAQLRQRMEAVCERHPSVVVRLTSPDETIWGYSCGVADLVTGQVPTGSTAYRIGSVTKTFTALATLKLRDQHRLRLDSSLRDILADEVPEGRVGAITVEQLLSHTSRLPRIGRLVYWRADASPTRSDVLHALRVVVMRSPGDAPYLYSNFGYAVLGLVVEQAAQKPFRDYLSAELLGPMGLRRTRWDREACGAHEVATGYVRHDSRWRAEPDWRIGAAEAAGGLYSSADDMASYLRLYLAAYASSPRAWSLPVARATIRESQWLSWHSSRGKRGPLFDRTGSTDKFSAAVVVAPDAQLGGVALANSTGSKELRVFLREALDLAAASPRCLPRLRGR